MATLSDFDAALDAVCQEWNRAEKAIKLAEQVNGEIVNPAIYELRYSGRRLIEAFQLKSSDLVAAKKLLDDAHFDCCRARHDAIDAATSKVVADLRIAIEKIGPSAVLTHFPKWTELYGSVQKVRRRIAVSREKRDDRNAIYASIQSGDLQQIVDLYDEFTINEPIIKAAGRRDKLIVRGGVVLTIIGLVLTVIFGILPLFDGA